MSRDSAFVTRKMDALATADPGLISFFVCQLRSYCQPKLTLLAAVGFETRQPLNADYRQRLDRICALVQSIGDLFASVMRLVAEVSSVWKKAVCNVYCFFIIGVAHAVLSVPFTKAEYHSCAKTNRIRGTYRISARIYQRCRAQPYVTAAEPRV